jgi:hypothetical protein
VDAQAARLMARDVLHGLGEGLVALAVRCARLISSS